ncbi:MAG: hypothetical protein V4850_33265 [Myxococcota bacterium]
MLFLAMACGSNQMFSITCPETTAVIAPSDGSALGFSPADARALVPDEQSLAVRWDEESYGPTEETFTVAVSPVGDPLRVDKEEGDVPDACRLGTSLRVPLSISVFAFDGGLIATFPGQIDAWSLDEVTWGMSDHADVTLTADFADEADAVAHDRFPGPAATNWRFRLWGTPTGGAVDLGYHRTDAGGTHVAGLLGGTWGDAEVE